MTSKCLIQKGGHGFRISLHHRIVMTSRDVYCTIIDGEIRTLWLICSHLFRNLDVHLAVISILTLAAIISLRWVTL